jgi:hypothetical protein
MSAALPSGYCCSCGCLARQHPVCPTRPLLLLLLLLPPLCVRTAFLLKCCCVSFQLPQASLPLMVAAAAAAAPTCQRPSKSFMKLLSCSLNTSSRSTASSVTLSATLKVPLKARKDHLHA